MEFRLADSGSVLFWFCFFNYGYYNIFLKIEITAMNLAKYCVGQSLIKMSLLYLHAANDTVMQRIFSI